MKIRFVLASAAAAAIAGIAITADADVTSRIAFTAGGRERQAVLYVPAGVAADRLVVMLHGAGGDAARIRRLTGHGLERYAARGRWVVAYPEGVGGTWNGCRRTPLYPAKLAHVDDVAYLRELMGRLRQRFGLAAADVLVAGYSNGAHMALRLALEAPGELGGIALVAAQLPTSAESVCPRDFEQLNALLIAGADDPLIPYVGGASFGPGGEPLGEVLSVAQTMQVLTAPTGRILPSRTVQLPEVDGEALTSVELREWQHPLQPLARLYILRGSGHVVPQREVEFPAVVGRSAGDVDFGEVMVDFVESWPRSRARERGSSSVAAEAGR